MHIDGYTLDTKQQLVFRVIEVEAPLAPGDPAKPSLDWLWPTSESSWDARFASDAKARIVKVSPPIEVLRTHG